MPDKLKLNLLAFLWLCVMFVKGQGTVTIPSDNSEYGTAQSNIQSRKPLGTYFGYERSALLLKNSEINQYGLVTSISVYCDSVNNPGKAPVRIYVKEVSDSVFSHITTVSEEETAATLVYDDTLPSSAFVKNQWVNMTLSPPFVRATSKPLEIIFETNAGSNGSEGALGKRFYYNNISLNNFQLWESDNTPPAGTGTLTTIRPNIQLAVTPIPACNGAPVAGSVTTPVDTVCYAQWFVLRLSGNTVATGLQYQWQDSLAGGSWTNISYADSSTLLKKMTQSIFYRCEVSCGSFHSYTAPKALFLKDYRQCYCVSDLGGDCSFNSAIDSVGIEGTSLANGHTGCSLGSYIQYPATGNTTANLNLGQACRIHTRYSGNVVASIWIDYNQNGALEASEWNQICLQSPANGSSGQDSDIVISINIPNSATPGLTLMRIRTRSSGNTNDTSSACTTFSSGETEDYYVTIVDPNGIYKINENNTVLRIYPNPASEHITIYSDFTTGEILTLNLYSLNGSLVSSVKTNYKQQALIYDIPPAENGVYLLQIISTRRSYAAKLIINR